MTDSFQSIDPSSAPSSRPAHKTYGASAVRGAFWFALAVALTKLSTFLAQLALGWMLSDGDFGLYALALSCSGLVMILKDGGTRKVLVHQGERYAELARPVFWVAMFFNLLAALTLVVAAPIAVKLFAAPDLAPLVWIIAASLPLSTFGTVQRTKLVIDLRFRAISSFNTASAVLRQLSTVVFALLGLGPMSFVLPLVVIAAFEAAVGWRLVGGLPKEGRLTWTLTKELLDRSRWLIMSTLAMTLIVQGDYLAVGVVHTKEVLGVYFFAYQLTVAISTPFSGAIASILTPSLTQLKDEKERQSKAYVKAVRVLCTIAAPLCVAAALVAPPGVHLLWAGKWDAAIPAVQLLALSIPIRLLTPTALSLIESQGRWRRSAAMLALDAAGNVVAAAAGALLGQVTSIAAWVSAERTLVSAIECLGAGRLVAARIVELAAAVLWPLIASCCAGALALGAGYLLPEMPPISLILTRAAFFVLFSALIGVVFFRARIRELLQMYPWWRSP